MRNYRFLFVFNRFRPAISGSEIHMHQIADSLIKRGHNVDVFTLNVLSNEDYIRSRGPLPARENIGGINVRRFNVTALPLHNRVNKFLEQHSVLPYMTGYRRVYSIPMAAALRNVKYDCIIGGVMPFAGVIYPALKRAQYSGAKSGIIPLIHLGVPHDNRYRYEYFSKQCLALYKMADLIIVNAEIETRFLRDNGYTGDIIRINPVIEKQETVNRQLDTFNVCSLGFANYEKGVDHSLKAFELFSRGKSDVRFIVAGTVHKSYKENVSGSDKIIYRGMIAEESKKQFFSDCDVYMQPSMAESFGIATLEAHSAGIPSINAYCSGSMEIISHGENGFLVPFGDYKMTAEYLNKLYNDVTLRKSMGEKAKEMSSRYDYNNHIEGIEKLEESLQ
ncbi:MAG: glycosyltransferase family 4 protein [candidate division WOR-3 bacterium]|nr:glycosyltransferase family 4 protein [candidate division WOR-3 bacterium]